MSETKLAQRIFSLSVAREMAEREGSQADMLVFLIKQALKEARTKRCAAGSSSMSSGKRPSVAAKNETAVPGR